MTRNVSWHLVISIRVVPLSDAHMRSLGIIALEIEKKGG